MLRKLEAKLSQRMQRVLIVEDDAVQREAVGKLLTSHDVETVRRGTAAECLDLSQGADLRLHGARSLPARCLRLFAAGDAEPGGRLFLPAGHRLHRPRPVGRRRAAAAPLFQIDHHQGREIAGAAARRGDAVPAPGRLGTARRTAEDDPQGAQPRRDSRRPAHPGRRGRCAQRLCADQHPGAARRDRRDRPQRPGGAGRAGKIRDAAGRRSTWC